MTYRDSVSPALGKRKNIHIYSTLLNICICTLSSVYTRSLQENCCWCKSTATRTRRPCWSQATRLLGPGADLWQSAPTGGQVAGGAADTGGRMSGRGQSGTFWTHSLSEGRGRSRVTRSSSRRAIKYACWPLCEVSCGGILLVAV